ncbi:hypothetical protein BGZ98_005892 [Dissophora globulifera]|nr:hypothetical protein BGZ98_005892 [Dissophora globulifera]
MDGWIVLFQPVNTKDDWMLEPRDVEGQDFMVCSDRERDGSKVGNGTRKAGGSVSHIEPDGMIKRGGWELEGSDGGNIDERFLGTGINEGERSNRRRLWQRDSDGNEEVDMCSWRIGGGVDLA